MLNNQLKLDLHGMSLEKSAVAVNDFIQKAAEQKVESVHIVTGRGNHVQKKPNALLDNNTLNTPTPQRGALFKKLPKLLSSESLIYVRYLVKNLGSYDVYLRDSTQKNTKSLPLVLEATFEDETDFMRTVRLPESEQKNQLLQEMLLLTPAALEQVRSDGTTVLMIAASCNFVKTMNLLLAEERDLYTETKLLKKTRKDGANVLMVAVLHSHEESINFLLNKAPSLLKAKLSNNRSIFSLVEKTKEPLKTLSMLHKHLVHHKREKGYTDLFREYKLLKKELEATQAVVANDKEVAVIDSKSLKKRRSEHSWFYKDRMQAFLSYLKNFKKSYQGLEKEARFMVQTTELSKLRVSFKRLLKNNEIRVLFLRFNNSIKDKITDRFKRVPVAPMMEKPVKKTQARPKKPKALLPNSKKAVNSGGMVVIAIKPKKASKKKSKNQNKANNLNIVKSLVNPQNPELKNAWGVLPKPVVPLVFSTNASKVIKGQVATSKKKKKPRKKTVAVPAKLKK